MKKKLNILKKSYKVIFASLHSVNELAAHYDPHFEVNSSTKKLFLLNPVVKLIKPYIN